MKAYISVSFRYRQTLDGEITVISDTLKEAEIQPFVFVDHYRFEPTQERQMMQQAMQDIDDCDLLLAETSDKGIGIGETPLPPRSERIITNRYFLFYQP